MAITESKVKEGKLVLGGTVFPAVAPAVDFSCPPTNVRLEPTHDETGDAVETLCGDTLSPDTTTSWSLMGTAIQDFDDPDGLVWYAYDHNGETVDFAWQPNTGATKWVGKVTVRALVIGGDVNTRITSDFEWPATDLVPTKPTALMAMTASSSSAKADAST